MKLIASGAEARVYDTAVAILKRRVRKSYRIPEIDDRLRSQRTRREAKVIEKLCALDIPVPKVYNQRGTDIRLEKIDGPQLATFAKNAAANKFFRKVGAHVAKMHEANIIHGDLTTSNMLVSDKVYLIDFGLSFFSARDEDKAVDLHVLKETVNARHNQHASAYWESFVSGYKRYKNSQTVLKRLTKVEGRGRYKGREK